VSNRKKDIDKSPVRQGAEAVISEPNEIGALTPYDFEAKNLTAYGGLLPVATMLERLGFQQLIEETLTVKRLTRAMSMYQFVLAMVLAVYVGFSRLHHLRFVTREPMLTGHPEGLTVATAVHVLALPGFAALGRGPTTVERAATDARTGVAGSTCGFEGRHVGHRHHRAHAVWPADGRP
jgi:hypothetical protein